MPNPTRDELYTTVRNISGVPKYFGFLGSHGMTLAVDEIFAQPGDLVAKLGAKLSRRKFAALERALANDLLEIRSTPMPLFYDPTLDKVSGLAVDNGVLGLVDPTYNSSASADFAGV